MSASSTSRVVRSRQKLVKLEGDTTVEAENNQGDSLETPVGQDTNKLAKLESPNKEVNQLAVSSDRPISHSEFEVAHTVNVMGIRPVGVNTMQIVDSINQSGIRPISSSALAISQTYSSMGNRPIASNQIDDPSSLMGFLD